MNVSKVIYVPQPGQVWKHYKGDYYVIVGTALNATNGEEPKLVVIYRNITDTKMYVRDHLQFMDRLPDSQNRFEKTFLMENPYEPRR